MPYIERTDGKITGAFARQQFEGQEQIADTHPEYILFRDGDPRQNKIDRAHEIVAEKVAALSEPLDYLRTTVITGLQGDRARGKPIDVTRQAILDDSEADARKVMAEELLIAADDIIANIDAIEDIDQSFIDRNIT